MQTAKRMVYGIVDIDKMAGPSEVLVIADGSARAHGSRPILSRRPSMARATKPAMLLTPSRTIAEHVADAIEEALADLPRAEAVRRVLERRGALVVVR